MKILLVEDEYLIAMVEKNALKNYGYEVTHVPSGDKAIEVVKTEVFDLILMDINLENELDGIETAQIILDDLDIPIIFVSSHTEKEVVERTERVTSYGYVVKSSTITVLDASIKMAMKLFKAKKEVEKYALASRDTEEELAIIAEHLKVKADEMILAEKIAKVGNWKLDLTTNKINGSEGACRIYGLPNEEAFDYSLIHSVLLLEYVGISDMAMRLLISEGKPYDIVVKIRRGDEIATVNSIAFYDKETNTVFGVIKDMTEISRLEIELKEKNLFLNAILENAPIGISVTDRDGNALRYNHRLYSILGMDEKDLRAKKYLNRKYIKRDGSIRLKEEMPSYIAINEGRVVEPTEIGIIKEDGNEIWVNVSAAPMEDGSCIVLTNDITYRVERRNVNK